ncbi:MAG: DNA polymerase I [Omnitrophica WOR_2 bacterium RIFCSPHIGHO2_02_FULL_45_21]|nr:MAG: DNA polymerase I [Omnitrophica WOR_2 bacterium RIFCSPHIGHO2_02_FULL_45_21]
MSSPKIYLIDGSGLCYRAFYALPHFTTSQGQPTGAVLGFTNILNKILRDKPDYIACCFDVSRETFRQKKYKEYKSQRSAMPDELKQQMALIKEVVSSYNIAIAELEGYEADDLLASLAQKARKESLEVLIVSSDKDILQLVDEKIKVFDPRKDKEGMLHTIGQVRSAYGLEPQQLPDFFALTGDAADNIPGVKGVGEKTALMLLEEFGNVENMIKNASQIKSEGLREEIQNNTEAIRLSYDLLKLRDELDVDFNLDKLSRKEPDYDRLWTLFKQLEFNSLLKKLPANVEKEVKNKIISKPLEDKITLKEKILGSARLENEFYFFLTEPRFCVQGLGEDTTRRIYLSSGEDFYSLAISDPQLQIVLEEPTIKKISHNLKEAKLSLLKNSINLQGLYFDTMLAAYLVDSSLPEYGLPELAFRYLEEKYPAHTFGPEESLSLLIRLKPILEEKLKEYSQDKLFYELEMPLVEVMASMTLAGVKIDTKALADLSKDLERRLIDLRGRIYALNSGGEFNLNSPKQLQDVLFGRLKLPVIKRKKSGPSTDEEVLRKLSRKHKLPLLILEYRQLTKLKNTYVDSLPALINSKTSRIHATFDQAGTETGRISSHNPNLQNIPARGDIAGLIRRSFIAEKGNSLICADYSQIELRVLAHFSEDEALRTAFKNGLDIHRHTASLIFQVDQDALSQEMRDTAKRINFGIVYGMSSFGLAKDLEIAPHEAQNFIDSYFLRYPGVKDFIEKQIKQVRISGYVQTLLGRRRYLPGIGSSNNALMSFAERQAVNSPIQGSAADLIKLAMVDLCRALKEKKLESKLIMQIHDELVFEVINDEAPALINLLRDKMENVYPLAVPIKVNIKKGINWLEMEPCN